MSDGYPFNGHRGYPPTPHSSSPVPPPRPTAQNQPPATGPYNDPANLLRVYPFMTYQPTARAAMHLSPHTAVHPPPSSSTQLFPQHADLFRRLDHPASAEDWELRKAVHVQARAALANAGPSYSYSKDHYSAHRPGPHSTYNSSQLPPYPPSGAIPMPYDFLPSYLPPSHQPAASEPLTPASMNGQSSPSPTEFYNNFVDQTLQKQQQLVQPTPQSPRRGTSDPLITEVQPPSSAASTPCLSRAMARAALTPSDSPDLLGMGPSPSKKHKSNREGSLTLGIQVKLPGAGQRARVLAESSSLLPSSPLISESGALSGFPPSSEAGDDESEEDDLDWGDDNATKEGDWRIEEPDHRAFSSPSVASYGGIMPPGSGRTGERDMRSHFQKLTSLLEDIFEEADSMSAEPSMEELASARFFASSRSLSGQIVLSNRTVEKLTRYTNRVQKCQRRQSAGERPDWNTESVGRILRIIEKSMIGLDSLIPFPSDKQAIPKKKAKIKKGEKEGFKSPPKSDEELPVELTPEVIVQGETILAAFCSAGLAAECALVILSTEGISKQLISEDLLIASVGLTKDLIVKVVTPVVESLGGDKSSTSSPFFHHVLEQEVTSAAKVKTLAPLFTSPYLSAITHSAVASLPLISSLLGRSDISFSDQLVIQTVYLAISPLFVSEPPAKKRGKGVVGPGVAVMKGLRVEALGCLRGVFARYDSQRQWIIEEILGSMGRSSESALPRFQLANGASIHMISALLLQLIQASAFGVIGRVRKLRAASTLVEEAAKPSGDSFHPWEEESRLCVEAMESALSSARAVATYLVQRSGASKSSKSTHDTDYKAVLDCFVADLLNVLYRPEWPAAPLYLTVFSRIMVSALEEPKGGDSAIKGVALDYLGDVGAKLRIFHLEMNSNKVTPSLDEIISESDVEACSQLAQKHLVIHDALTQASKEDGMYAGALDMSILLWAQELHSAIKKANSVIERMAEEKDNEVQKSREKLQTISQSLTSTLQSVWGGAEDVFEVAKPDIIAEANAASVAIARGRPLQNAFGPILGALVTTMGVSIIALRSKALRGLGSIVTADPEVLTQAAVRRAIEERLVDASPAVRDAAVELVGKYVVQKPGLAAEYYPRLALLVSDPGLAVRKRVIKLLRGIFSTTTENEIKVDICCKMISLFEDMDENIQELAVKTATQMLFLHPPEKGKSAALLVDVVASFQGSLESLESAIADIVNDIEQEGRQTVLSDTVAVLFDRLGDSTEQLDIDPLSHIRAIHLLVTARPNLVDVHRAESLLTYLRRKPVNADEQASNEVLLKIFRRCIPLMPHVASTFATKLVEQLVPMISVPSGGFPILRETVACFCAVANHLTRDFAPILRVLINCEAKTWEMRNEFKTTGTAAKAKSPAAPILLFICASIAEFCNLDELAENDAFIEEQIMRITDGSLYEHLFECFLDFTKMPIAQMSPSLCLGSLFRAYPVLILRTEALEWIDGVFASNDTITQARLLVCIYDFLVSEREKKQSDPLQQGKKARKGDMQALIGNTAELSESGLSTAVVQRNIGHILTGAKSQHGPTHNAALDILAFTINQGLYHPLQCLPVLVSLETSDNVEIAERALALHQILHSKHSTLVNVRFLEFAKASYEYHRSINAEVSGHRDGIALLVGWYNLIGEKRSWRHDFLKQICRVFDSDLGGQVVPDVGLVLYLCDNLATLEFKLQEEVMITVHLLSAVISQSTELVMILENVTLGGDAGDDITGQTIPTAEIGEDYRADVVIHASIVVGLALLTKNHLLDAYGLVEDKCIQHVPGKKSSMGDKPAQRRREGSLDTGRMPLALGVQTVRDFNAQRATFLGLIHEDSAMDDF